jgi:hypothetical protein
MTPKASGAPGPFFRIAEMKPLTPSDLPGYRTTQSAHAVFGAAAVAVRAAGSGQMLDEASRALYGVTTARP